MKGSFDGDDQIQHLNARIDQILSTCKLLGVEMSRDGYGANREAERLRAELDRRAGGDADTTSEGYYRREWESACERERARSEELEEARRKHLAFARWRATESKFWGGPALDKLAEIGAKLQAERNAARAALAAFGCEDEDGGLCWCDAITNPHHRRKDHEPECLTARAVLEPR